MIDHVTELTVGNGEVPVDGDEQLPAGTPLDDLRAELRAKIDRPPVTMTVPGRPRYEVRYSTSLDGDLLGRWTKASADRSSPNGVNELALSCRVLAGQCEVIVRDGDELTHDGRPVTFRSRVLLDMLDVSKPTQAVRAFYGIDGHVLAAALEVVRACGFAEDTLSAAGADPTPER